jgi:hypothetical protein
MTPFRQIEASRRNALRSTGPKTEEGKQKSRRNALRHGLTAETAIEGLEDSEDYRAFEAAVVADWSTTRAPRSNASRRRRCGNGPQRPTQRRGAASLTSERRAGRF